jgi:hypothetical protein
MTDEYRPPTPEELDAIQAELEVPKGRKLDNLADVRKAMAFVVRRIERGTLDYKRGHTVIMGLNCLAAMMQDARDSTWVRRARVLWQEREAAKGGQPQADH